MQRLAKAASRTVIDHGDRSRGHALIDGPELETRLVVVVGDVVNEQPHFEELVGETRDQLRLVADA